MKRSKGSSMDDVLKLLGLAYRARKLVLGEEVLHQIRKVRILFLASDISKGSEERYLKKCHYYDIFPIDVYDSEELSSALGKNNVKVIGVLDQGFADALMKKVKQKEGYHGQTDIQKASE